MRQQKGTHIRDLVCRTVLRKTWKIWAQMSLSTSEIRYEETRHLRGSYTQCWLGGTNYEHHNCKHSQFWRKRGNANWVSIGWEFQVLSKIILKEFLIRTKIIIHRWVFKYWPVDVKDLCQICRRDWKTLSPNPALEFFSFHNCIGVKFLYQILISFIQIGEKVISILVSKPF